MLKDYYTIKSMTPTEEGAVCKVALNPDCEVYRGHFPGEPVSPGVCNIRMIQECARLLLADRTPSAGKAVIGEVQQCRFTSLITPQTHPELEVRIELKSAEPEDGAERWALRAAVLKGEDTCLTLKAILRS